jgi:hypothetical protein
MTEAWSKLRVPRARLSPSGAVPVAEPWTGPPTGEQFAALAVLAAIAAQQEAARQAASVSTRPQYRPQHAAVSQQGGDDQLAASQQSSGDQLAPLLAEIEAAQRKGSRPC